jgi:hypothetical protein
VGTPQSASPEAQPIHPLKAVNSFRKEYWFVDEGILEVILISRMKIIGIFALFYVFGVTFFIEALVSVA